MARSLGRDAKERFRPSEQLRHDVEEERAASLEEVKSIPTEWLISVPHTILPTDAKTLTPVGVRFGDPCIRNERVPLPTRDVTVVDRST